MLRKGKTRVVTCRYVAWDNYWKFTVSLSTFMEGLISVCTKWFPFIISFYPHNSAGIIMCVLVALSCPTLCDPMDCNPPGSSVRGILQARILEKIAISSSRASSWLRNQTRVSCISCIDRWILYLFKSLFWMLLTWSEIFSVCRMWRISVTRFAIKG